MAEKKLKTKNSKLKNTDQKSPIKSGSRMATTIGTKTQKVKVQTDAKQVKQKSGMKVDVYDLTGKVVESISLPSDIFGVKVNKKLIAQAVRVYQANQRAGSANTKTRGEVRGSTRKIYRQKGTGRARHGGIRAPIFVHGGIAHGPKTRDFSLKMPQKMKRAALNSLLSLKMNSGEIKILSGFDQIDGKTKNIAKFLKVFNLKGKKILFVFGKRHENIILAVRNIQGVTYEFVKQLHVYEIMRNREILFMKDSIADLESFMKNKDSK